MADKSGKSYQIWMKTGTLRILELLISNLKPKFNMENPQGSFNKSLENPRDGAHSPSYIHYMVSFLLSIEAKHFCVFRKMEKSEFRSNYPRND